MSLTPQIATILQNAKIKPDFCVPFNHRVVGSKVLVASDLGDWLFLTPDEFGAFIEGKPKTGDGLHQRLKDANLLAAEIDQKAAADRWQRDNAHLLHGPWLHTLALTGRDNQTCAYRPVGEEPRDMSIAVAERAIDLAFQTTSPALTIALQGGEPLLNWEVLQHAAEYARQKNALAGKSLSFVVESNLSLLDDDKLDYLIDRRIEIRTRLDGPADLHNALHALGGGSAYAVTAMWIEKIHKRYEALGLDPSRYRVPVTVTVTRASLGRGAAIVAELADLGCRAVTLQPVDVFGLSRDKVAALGCTTDEFLGLYTEVVGRMLGLEDSGAVLYERHAGTLLGKLLGRADASDLGLRSPGSSCVGQLCYGEDGIVYSSTEGHAIARLGDPVFEVGTVDTNYQDLVSSDGTRALVMGGLLHSQPDCVNCAYKPMCGQQVEFNYKTQGSIHGRMRDSSWCRRQKALFDHFADALTHASPARRVQLERWAEPSHLEHFALKREAL